MCNGPAGIPPPVNSNVQGRFTAPSKSIESFFIPDAQEHSENEGTLSLTSQLTLNVEQYSTAGGPSAHNDYATRNDIELIELK